MDYIKQHYDLPFLVPGMRIEVDGKMGTIKKEKNAHLLVNFDSGNSAPVHPTWQTAYFDQDMNILKDFREQKRSPEVIMARQLTSLEILQSGKPVYITNNLKLMSLTGVNWDDNILISVSANFTFFNLYASADIVVEEIEEDTPRYAMIESEDEIHHSLKSTLTNDDIWNKLVPILKEYKTEFENQPF